MRYRSFREIIASLALSKDMYLISTEAPIVGAAVSSPALPQKVAESKRFEKSLVSFIKTWSLFILTDFSATSSMSMT